MKKLFLALLLPICLMAEVGYKSDNSMAILEREMKELNSKTHGTNVSLEKINKSLTRLNRTMDRIFKAMQPMAYDNNGNLIEDYEEEFGLDD